MPKLIKHRDNVYVIVRYDILDNVYTNPHVVGVYEVDEDAFNQCDSFNQEYYDRDISHFKFEVQISQYYAR